MKHLFFFLFLLCLALPAFAEEGEGDRDAKGASGLPLPRFASLQPNEVNMRTGPGVRYPIEWVFVQQGLPVEITAEYEIWRRVRDFEGAEGWVHKSALTGKRTAIVTGSLRDLRRKPDDGAPILAHLQTGCVGKILSCDTEWCQLKFQDIKGYLRKTDFWGAYPDEMFD